MTSDNLDSLNEYIEDNYKALLGMAKRIAYGTTVEPEDLLQNTIIKLTNRFTGKEGEIFEQTLRTYFLTSMRTVRSDMLRKIGVETRTVLEACHFHNIDDPVNHAYSEDDLINNPYSKDDPTTDICHKDEKDNLRRIIKGALSTVTGEVFITHLIDEGDTGRPPTDVSFHVCKARKHLSRVLEIDQHGDIALIR